MEIALEVIENILRHHWEGQAINHPRVRINLPQGAFNFMAAATPVMNGMGFKVYPNLGRALKI